ncbi:MAG: alpha/beta hydrolase [Deltaproteobacteria bacterium]|nr:alpha/beta hydrolase [Deltaproteobacteria bacterium]
MGFLKVVIWVAAVAGSPPAAAYVVSRYFLIDRRPDRTHFLTTPDGWTVALHEYRPPEGAPARTHPVLLAHGFGGNHHIFDFAEGLSVARYLAARGHRVFSLDLRGAGDSEKVALFSAKTFSWTFDAYRRHDIPAAIDAVLRLTGAKKLHWIGHSMGGMLGYDLGRGEDADRLASVTAISAPGRLAPAQNVPSAPAVVVRTRRFFERWISCVTTPILEGLGRTGALSNFENLRDGDYSAVAANLHEDVPTAIGRGLARWAPRDVPFKAPLFVVAGESDPSAPPSSAKIAFDAADAPVKKFLALGTAHGQKEVTAI